MVEFNANSKFNLVFETTKKIYNHLFSLQTSIKALKAASFSKLKNQFVEFFLWDFMSVH